MECLPTSCFERHTRPVFGNPLVLVMKVLDQVLLFMLVSHCITQQRKKACSKAKQHGMDSLNERRGKRFSGVSKLFFKLRSLD